MHTWTDITGSGRVQDSVTVSDGIASFAPLTGTQYTESENHPSWRARSKGTFTGDLGGPFLSRKTYASGIPVLVELSGIQTASGRTDGATYSGPCLPIAPSLLSFPPSAESSNTSLIKKGTDAIAICAPSSPSADLTTAMGEIFQDGLPSAIGEKLTYWRYLRPKARRRAIGHEFLNLEFGWQPLMSDFTRLCKSIIHGQSIMDNYEANSGKLVRRKFGFPVQESESVLNTLDNRTAWIPQSTSLLYTNAFPVRGRVTCIRKTYKLQWFSGAFTYYVPPPDGSLRTDIARAVIAARHTLGISLTPDSVWNLAPWSWAVDWFGNTGSVLRNWANWAIDGQVLRYGYMMEHTVNVDTWTFIGPSGFRTAAVPFDVTLVNETKKRIKATPFGFGLSFSGFSPLQLAIIGALGLSRS